jgi:LPXTG-motif cell wall-anchored protein
VAGLTGMSLVGLGAGPAFADTQQCGGVQIENSLDGGDSWSTTGRFEGDAPTSISVRLVGTLAEGCEYPVSLASYSAEGPSWESSGEQAFLGWDTTVLSSETPEATLDVSGFAPSCFGQIDLYGNGTKYDGVEGALPHYPDSPTPENLIAAWNGEAPCEEEPPVDEPEEPSEEPEEPSEEPTPEPTDAPADNEPEPSGGGAEEPVGEPIALPEDTTVELAETGGDSSQMTLYASVGAGLLVVGAGALFLVKRRGSSAS